MRKCSSSALRYFKTRKHAKPLPSAAAKSSKMLQASGGTKRNDHKLTGAVHGTSEKTFDDEYHILKSKDILTSNWQCQLATIKAETLESDKKQIHRSFVPYHMLGKPLICLCEDDAHGMNLFWDDRVSLTIGRSDPPALMHAFQVIGKKPPMVVLFGNLEAIENDKIPNIGNALAKMLDDIKEVTQEGNGMLSTILKDASDYLTSQYTGLSKLVESNLLYWLQVRTCYYVDINAKKHKLADLDFIQAQTDCFGACLSSIIEAINQNKERRLVLLAFCAVYKHIKAQDAFMYSINRWGFDVLAKVFEPKTTGKTSHEGHQVCCWKEIHFKFAKEAKEASSLCHILVEMENDCLNLITKSLEESQT